MLRFKAAVRMRRVYPELLPVLRHVCDWSERSGIDVRMTSAADGAAGRSKNSLHPDDLAWDFSITHSERVAKLEDLARYLRRRLGDPYDIVAHGPTSTSPADHVHVEADHA